MSWREEAACKGRDDIDWFPTQDRPGGTTTSWRENLRRAREVCASCDVRSDCLADALAHWGTGGIWAGTTELERTRLPMKRPVRPHVARCGTDAGYYRHLRQTFTEPCGACKEAHAIAGRIRSHQLAVVR